MDPINQTYQQQLQISLQKQAALEAETQKKNGKNKRLDTCCNLAPITILSISLCVISLFYCFVFCLLCMNRT